VPKISSTQVRDASRFRWRPDELAAFRRSARCGMMIGCAVSTGLSGCDERVRVTATASGERPGQGCGDLGAAPPDHGARTAVRHDPAAVLSRRSGVPGRPAAPAPEGRARRFRLLVRPETVLRWHRNLLARRHAARSRPKSPGRPRTVHSIRQLVLRLAAENPCYVDPGIMWSLAAD
jgi:hypothetical protein